MIAILVIVTWGLSLIKSITQVSFILKLIGELFTYNYMTYKDIDFNNKIILITGGAGFIGSKLGYMLAKRGYEVLLLDDLSYGHEDNLTINGYTFGTFKKIITLIAQ